MTTPVLDPHVIDATSDDVRLLGGRCTYCGETHFPRHHSCQRCGELQIETVRLSTHGTLWSWTIQRFPPPSPPWVPQGREFTPFAVGYVELPGEVIVETLLTESDATRLSIGMPMHLTLTDVIIPVGDTRHVVKTFAFAPTGAQER